MIGKLREILLTRYIGSILVALLVWQAMIEVVLLVVRTGFWYYNHVREQSVLLGSTSPAYRWDELAFTIITVVLYLLTAYGLARWLYPGAASTGNNETDRETTANQPESSS